MGWFSSNGNDNQARIEKAEKSVKHQQGEVKRWKAEAAKARQRGDTTWTPEMYLKKANEAQQGLREAQTKLGRLRGDVH